MTTYRKALKARIAAATPGPAKKELTEDGQWRIFFPHSPRGFHGGCDSYTTCADGNDAELARGAHTDLIVLLMLVERAEAAIAEHKRVWGTSHPEAADVQLYATLASIRSVLDGRAGGGGT